MKEIKLNKWGMHKGGYVTFVDDEDYEFLNQFQWNAKKCGNNFYVVHHATINGKRVNIRMHRMIMHTPQGMFVDHIDHNGLNNQKVNLRNCTASQNSMNAHPLGISRFIGVSKRTGDKKWFAQIKVNKKTLFLGLFEKEEDAARVRDVQSIKYFGEFAFLNFPELRERYMEELSTFVI